MRRDCVDGHGKVKKLANPDSLGLLASVLRLARAEGSILVSRDSSNRTKRTGCISCAWVCKSKLLNAQSEPMRRALAST